MEKTWIVTPWWACKLQRWSTWMTRIFWSRCSPQAQATGMWMDQIQLTSTKWNISIITCTPRETTVMTCTTKTRAYFHATDTFQRECSTRPLCQNPPNYSERFAPPCGACHNWVLWWLKCWCLSAILSRLLWTQFQSFQWLTLTLFLTNPAPRPHSTAPWMASFWTSIRFWKATNAQLCIFLIPFPVLADFLKGATTPFIKTSSPALLALRRSCSICAPLCHSREAFFCS